MSIKEVENVRASIARLTDERAELTHYPHSRAEIRTMVQARIDAWEKSARNRAARWIGQIAQGDASPMQWADTTVSPGSFSGEADLGPILSAVVGAERLRNFLLTDLNDIAPDGPDKEARKARLAQIGAELDVLEAQEERLIERSEQAGAPIERRADARAEIVLGKPDPVHQPESSRSHCDDDHGKPPRAIPSPYVGKRSE